MTITTSSDYIALLRRICEDPGDIFAREVYADYLDQYGDDADRARAEFVRVQCELAKPCLLGYSDTYHVYDMCAACDPLDSRERELLRDHYGEWVAPVLEILGVRQSPQLHGLNNLDGRLSHESFRRGFPAAITCTLADWVGGPCERCNGTGELTQSLYCHHCNKTGRVGGHGPVIVQAAPIEEVRLSDRRPEHVLDNEPYYHWLSAGNGWREAEEYIPGCLYARLPRDERNRFRWTTETAANLALSAAALTWARQQAGLPAWVPKGVM